MVRSTKPKNPFTVQNLAVNFLFVLFYFLYFYFRLDAKLFYQAQQPVFYFDAVFAKDFLTYPGGLFELITNFLSQFFYYTWSGALLLTAVCALIALSTWLVMRTALVKTKQLWIHWLPTLCFFVLYHDYSRPLSLALGFVVGLFAAALFLRTAPKFEIARFFFFLILYCAVYVLTGGPALLLVLLIVFHEIIFRRKIVLPILFLIIAGLAPFLGHSYFFIQPLESSYFIHLGDVSSLSSWPMYTASLLVVLPFLLGHLWENGKINPTAKLKIRGLWLFAAQLLGVAAIVLLISILSFNKKEKALWQMDYWARHGDWQAVIHVIQKGNLLDVYIGQFQLHRALYHTGRLCESMFDFPQPSKSDALFLHPSVRHLFPLQYSDLYFDLGLINEAQHWAHEALSVTGDAPCNLQRLAEVNILKGEHEVAKKCLRQLQKSLWQKKWADDLLAALEHSNLAAFPYLVQKKQFMVQENFIVIPMRPQDCLDKLLEANPMNQMAFEYDMATLMLNGSIGRLVKNIDGMQYFPYRKTPRHLEEAMLLYVANTGRRDFEPPQLGISRETIDAFRDYMAIAKKYSGSPSAYTELARTHRDTFWFYASFIFKKDS